MRPITLIEIKLIYYIIYKAEWNVVLLLKCSSIGNTSHAN